MALVTSINNLNRTSTPSRNNKTIIVTGRVTDVVLNSNLPSGAFEKVGKYNGIGAIFFDILDYPFQGNQYKNNIAFPLFPNQTHIPVPNELVSIFYFPGIAGKDLDNFVISPNKASSVAYYCSTVNIFRNFHHNIYPPILDDINPNPNDQRTPSETEAGAYQSDDNTSYIPDNGYGFAERLNLKELQPFLGDVIYKGRWGQSIRFGSTSRNQYLPNPWSSEGEEGDPITIIRNGQNPEDDYQENKEIPQIENINKDISSIYLTSTQVLPFSPSSANYSSYTTQVNDVKNPTPPTVYNGNQIILTSNRLFFNASEDSILLSSKESINLNTLSSINFESKKGIVLSPGKEDSSKIYLGGITAQDTVIKGNKFLDDFDQLLSQIRSLAKALQSDIGSSVPNVPNPTVAPVAKLLELHVNSMVRDIENYKSKTTRII